MAKIMTVNGEIDAVELGVASMHEHLMVDTSVSLGPALEFYGAKIPEAMKKLTMENLSNLRTGTSAFSKECCTLEDLDYTIKELSYFKAAGGNAIVDASPLGMPHNLKGLQEASKQSGIQIVVCTGLYITAAQPEEYKEMSEDALVEKFLKDIADGIDDTGVRPGFLKCAINTLDESGEVDEYELKAVRACARAAVKSGLSIHIHNAYPLEPRHIVPVAKMVLSLGVQPDRLLMLHMGAMVRSPRRSQDYVNSFNTPKTVTIDLALSLLKLGINIGFDCYGNNVVTLPDNDDMNKALLELIRKGYGDHITVGHDITDKVAGVSFGGDGFTNMLKSIPPVLKENNCEDAYEKLFIKNPARILAY